MGTVLGTPAYMAPEQARGEAVDERADVYALGAMLYYLLAGAPPRSGTTVREVLAAAVSERPRPVAERAPDAPPDLVAIVDKAMELEADRRYPTARELAEDVRRFQTGQLVSAHRYSPGELVRRWVRQHRAAVTVAAVLGLALATAVIGGFLAVRRQARIAEAQRDRARMAAAEAEQANAFLKEMLGSADPRTSGKEVTVASVLDRASERLDEQLGGQPEVKSSLQLTLGQTYQGLGLLDPAERLVRAAVEGRAKVHGPDSADVARAREALASVLLDRGDLTTAETLYREAIATFDRIGDADSDAALSARADLATTLQNLGRFDEAEAQHRDALEHQRRVYGSESLEVATSLNNLGVVLGQRGDWVGAEALHRESLNVIRRVKGPRSPEVAAALASVGNAVDPEETSPGRSRSIASRSQCVVASLDPSTPTPSAPSTPWPTCSARGESREAEALCREALALRGRVSPTPTRWWPGSCRSSASASWSRAGPPKPSRCCARAWSCDAGRYRPATG